MPYPIPFNRNIYVEYKEFDKGHEMKNTDTYRDYYGISFIKEGDRKLITPNMISILRSGDVGFTTMHMYHRATFATNCKYARYLIKFTPYLLKGLLAEINKQDINDYLRLPVFHFSKAMSDKIEQSFLNMLNEYENYDEHTSEIILKHMLYQLIILVEREHLTNIGMDKMINNANEKILDALYYLDCHFTANPRVDYVASLCGYSTAHFSRIFKQITGNTYSAYVCSLKLHRSMDLLVNSEYSIETIAQQSGFSDASYLCHLFNRTYHITPTQYRKSSRQENTGAKGNRNDFAVKKLS